ncbi:hypothetical protein B0H13DRAFT_2535268 [Mycena leptocephala]|nr:hypothetical protein B0H13DRAFT_2535268 [Mycena leptocephala]
MTHNAASGTANLLFDPRRPPTPMGTTDKQLEYWKCSTCLNINSNGNPQTKATARLHRNTDKREAARQRQRELSASSGSSFGPGDATLDLSPPPEDKDAGDPFDDFTSDFTSDFEADPLRFHDDQQESWSDSESDDPDWSFCQRQFLPAGNDSRSTVSDDSSDQDSDSSSDSDNDLIEDISNDSSFAPRASLFDHSSSDCNINNPPHALLRLAFFASEAKQSYLNARDEGRAGICSKQGQSL